MLGPDPEGLPFGVLTTKPGKFHAQRRNHPLKLLRPGLVLLKDESLLPSSYDDLVGSYWRFSDVLLCAMSPLIACLRACPDIRTDSM